MITLSWIQLGLLVLAGIGAGFVGYCVGLASLVSYPATLVMGLPPILANATNCAGVIGTAIGGCINARPELAKQQRLAVIYLMLGCAGGIVGGLLLLKLPATFFEMAAPVFIAASAIIVGLNPNAKKKAQATAQEATAAATGEAIQYGRGDTPAMLVGTGLVSIYSGYFGAGAGTLQLALLSIGNVGPYAQINALKTMLGGAGNIAATVMFTIAGAVNWPAAIALGIGTFIGGYAAPPVVRRVPEKPMRILAMIAGLVLAIDLGWKAYL